MHWAIDMIYYIQYEASLLQIIKLYMLYFDPLDFLSGVPHYFDRNKISSGGDLSHYSSASLY